MRLRIYDAHLRALGGGEKYVCALAEALAAEHHVTLLLDGTVAAATLNRRFNSQMKGVSFLSGGGQQANIVLSNDKPFGRKLAYIIQIPFEPITPASLTDKIAKGEIRSIEQDIRQRKVLWDAKRSKIVLVYSEFVRAHLEKHYGIKALVLSPPVDDFRTKITKRKVVLSVGRFFKRGWNLKRYDVLIEAFKLFHRSHNDWEYRIVGGSGPIAWEHVAELRQRAKGYPIRLIVDASYDDLKTHYGEATLFWHAAGFGATKPEDMEHFGISTLEAMSAGCMPFVVPKGGQREILMGYSAGLYWETIEDLVSASITYLSQPSHMKSWRANARKRFLDFTKERFAKQARMIFEPWKD